MAADKKDPFAFDLGFRSSAERLIGERARRLRNAKSFLPFGVKFLDKALGGISPKDLILIGARTGIGKSQLAMDISRHNAAHGKRVHLFALEAEDCEVEMRIKWEYIAKMIRDHHEDRSVLERLDYMAWYQGELEDLAGPYEADADEYVAKAYSSLNTFYRARNFTGADWEKAVLSIQSQTDLIVLDHLHYVDTDKESDENKAVKAIVKTIRDVALEIGKPVIVVAHVRKQDQRIKQLTPKIEDFHGSSDISKIATKAIMIAPAFDQEGDTKREPWQWPTYMAIGKCRPSGARTRFLGLLTFDARTNTYSSGFELRRALPGGDTSELVPDLKRPYWAREHGVHALPR